MTYWIASHLIWAGAIVLTVVLALFLWAWLSYRQAKDARAILLIVLAGLLLRLFSASDPSLHAWDERYHALVAKHMIDNPLKPVLYQDPVLPYDYRDWTKNHIWLHKQPMTLWSIGASIALFGTHELAVRLPSVLLSTLGIWLMFAIGRALWNRRIGVFAAFLYAIHGLTIELVGGRVATDHVDIHFMFFIQLAVWWSIKYMKTENSLFNVLTGAALGLALLSKWLPALLVLPLWVVLNYSKGKKNLWRFSYHFMQVLLPALLLAIPWQLYIHQAFPQEALWEGQYNMWHFTKDIEGHAQPFWFHFDRMRILYGEIIYLPVIWLLWMLFRKPHRKKRWFVALWIMIPFIVFSFARSKMQAYTLIAAPAMFLLTALFWNYLKIKWAKTSRKWVVNILLFLLLALPLRYMHERLIPDHPDLDAQQHAIELKNIRNQVVNEGNVVLFNMPLPIEAMFYSNATAYSHVPEKQILDSLFQRGYNLYIREEKVSNQLLESNVSDLVFDDGIIYRKYSPQE